MMFQFGKFLFLVLTVFSVGCAQTQKFFQNTPIPNNIKATEDIEWTDLKGNTQKIAAGTQLPPIDQAAHISAKGKVPMLIVSDKVIAQPYTVTLAPIEEWKPQKADEYIDKKLNEISAEVLQIIDDSQKRKFASAQQRAQSILRSNPRVASIHYLKAQVDILAGASKEAIDSLETALRIKPDYEKARKLLNEIQGRGVNR